MAESKVRQIAFVTHPRASRDPMLHEIENTLRMQNVSTRVMLSESHGHAVDLATKAAAECDLVVAVGGDGTLHEVANGLMKIDATKRPRIGLLPMGTGNDFAREFGHFTDVHKFVSAFARGDFRKIDVGVLECLSTIREARKIYFLCSVSLGFSPLATQIASTMSRKIFGKNIYAAALMGAFLRWRNQPITLEIDGNRTEHPNTFNLTVANTRFYGAGIYASAVANPCDGKLDLVHMEISKLHALLSLPKTFSGKFDKVSGVRQVCVTNVTVDSSEPILIQADGEIVGTTRARIGIEPNALRFCYPSEGA